MMKIGWMVFLILVVVPNMALSYTPVGGKLTENVIWRRNASPYLVVENINIDKDVTLNIEPGVQIYFQSRKKKEENAKYNSINVEGKIVARGTEDMPIVFGIFREDMSKPLKKYTSTYDFMFFPWSFPGTVEDSNYIDGSIFEWVKFRDNGRIISKGNGFLYSVCPFLNHIVYENNSRALLKLESVKNVFVLNSNLSHNESTLIAVKDTFLTILNSVFSFNTGGSIINAGNSRLKIVNCQYIKNRPELLISASQSEVLINGTTFRENSLRQDYSLVRVSQSFVIMENTIFKNNMDGPAVDVDFTESPVIMRNCGFVNNSEDGFDTSAIEYDGTKKTLFLLESSSFENNKANHTVFIDDGNIIQINKCSFKGNRKSDEKESHSAIYVNYDNSLEYPRITINECDFIDNGDYNISNNAKSKVIAQDNYWAGSELEIQKKIYDKTDNIDKGQVIYKPYRRTSVNN